MTRFFIELALLVAATLGGAVVLSEIGWRLQERNRRRHAARRRGWL